MATNSRGLDDYVSVHTRIEKFRVEHPAGRILTSILDGDPLTVRAEVYFNGSEVPNATAHASEEGGMAGRKSSALEKTETAAVGRALAFCGYEVKEGIAIREEMQKAARTPEMPDSDRELDAAIRAELKRIGKPEPAFQTWFEKTYETDSKWTEMSIQIKQDILMKARIWKKS